MSPVAHRTVVKFDLRGVVDRDEAQTSANALPSKSLLDVCSRTDNFRIGRPMLVGYHHRTLVDTDPSLTNLQNGGGIQADRAFTHPDSDVFGRCDADDKADDND